MSEDIYTDVCVIGGGPAGACCALKLAKYGHKVHLIESEKFPRQHIGESLTAGIIPLLKQLDILHPVEAAGFYRPEATFLHWGKINGDTPHPIDKGGFQVDRGVFDQLLLEQASSAGVNILQPALAEHPIETEKGWHIQAKYARQKKNIFAKKIVIASGKKTLLPSHRKRLSPPTLAIYAYWEKTAINGIESRVEAFDNGWLWGAPLPNGLFNIALFTNPDSSAFSSCEEIKYYYLQRISQSRLLSESLKGRRKGKLHICDASSYVVESPANNNCFFIGDAALRIDPLSSQGVQLSIKTAILAAIALHTQFATPHESKASIQFYTQKVHNMAHQHQAITERFYSEHGQQHSNRFWSRRMPALTKTTTAINTPHPPAAQNTYSPRSTPLKLADKAKLIIWPVLIGDKMKNLKALQCPGFERPVAFLQNIEIAPLIQFIENKNRTSREIIIEWGHHIGLKSAYRVLTWLLEIKAIKPVENKADIA